MNSCETANVKIAHIWNSLHLCLHTHTRTHTYTPLVRKVVKADVHIVAQITIHNHGCTSTLELIGQTFGSHHLDRTFTLLATVMRMTHFPRERVATTRDAPTNWHDSTMSGSHNTNRAFVLLQLYIVVTGCLVLQGYRLQQALSGMFVLWCPRPCCL